MTNIQQIIVPRKMNESINRLSGGKMAVYTKYGLTKEQYEALIKKSGNLCYICSRPPKKRALHIDHNHKTGRVRGLLCHTCNRFLIGRLGDRLDAVWLFKRAVKYLEENG